MTVEVFPSIAVEEPVDGYSVGPLPDGQISICFSNRYGHADSYEFGAKDAREIAMAILMFTKEPLR